VRRDLSRGCLVEMSAATSIRATAARTSLMTLAAFGCSCGARTDVLENDDASAAVDVADEVNRSDLGFEVWVSPEACPLDGVGVIEGSGCGVEGAECKYGCGDATAYRDFAITAKCVAATWTVPIKRRCTY